jgi:Flp pilus assembly pilin Flp
MTNKILRFASDQDGAVTVDWVVLTAAIVGLGIAVITVIAGGALDHSTGLGAHLQSQNVQTY